MDIKQKKNIYKLIYATIFVFVLIFTAIGSYFCVNNIVNVTKYMYISYALIAVYALLGLCFIVDFYKTDKLKNKYGVAIFLYLIVVISIVAITTLFVVFYIKDLTISKEIIISIILLVVCEFFTIIAFIIGEILLKLYSTTPITIDSTSKTPDYDDELMLKKKLDNLTRKLEMKKVQDKINEIQKELDE